jgi:hypothetical protein
VVIAIEVLEAVLEKVKGLSEERQHYVGPRQES